MMKNALKSASLLAAMGWICSCALVRPPATHLPVAWPATEPATNTPALTVAWWEDFQDTELNRIMGLVLVQNLDVQKAWARLEQASASARQVGGDRWPQISGEGGAKRTRALDATGEPQETDLFTLGLTVSYEVDLWGRVASLARAAREEYQATQADLETVAMTLAAETATAWFEAIEQQAQLDLLNRQGEASLQYLKLTESRFALGLSSALDIYQQRQQVNSIALLKTPVEARRHVVKNQLAVLTGRPPEQGDFTVPDVLPDVPPWPDAGLPSALLERRPDVRAALARLNAADERTAAAIAQRLPSLRLSGGAGYQAADAADLFDDWIGNLAANLAAPLIDGGKRAAESDRARAAAREQAAAAGQTLLRAMREAEDAMVLEAQQRLSVTQQETQRRLAEDTLTESRRRYMYGLSDYLPVLLALDRLQSAERSLLASKRQLLVYRIQVYRALGGDWSGLLTRPAPKGKESL